MSLISHNAKLHTQIIAQFAPSTSEVPATDHEPRGGVDDADRAGLELGANTNAASTSVAISLEAVSRTRKVLLLKTKVNHHYHVVVAVQVVVFGDLAIDRVRRLPGIGRVRCIQRSTYC